MKRFLILTIMLLSFFNSFALNAQEITDNKVRAKIVDFNSYNKIASNTNYIKYNNGLQVKPNAKYYDIDENGNYVIFPTLDDYIIYNTINTSFRNRYGYTWKTLSEKEKDLYFHFIQYHPGTPSWIKASKYTILGNKKFNVSTSYTWSNTTFNLGFSYSYGVSIDIPADSSRKSRLGVYADYTLKQIEVEQYQYGEPTGVKKTLNFATKNNDEIDPIYK